MWQAESRQRSFAEQEVFGAAGRNRSLEGIARLIDWKSLEAQLRAVYAAEEGRPAYRPLLLFKALVLAQWYQLSDPALEETLTDRLSFRRFVGLGLKQRVPDHSTLSRFRAQLAAHGLVERLGEELNRQLERHGLMLKRGTILDATLVAASVNPRRDPRLRPGEGSPLDPDAQWRGGTNHSGGRTPPCFGYKAHIAMDQGSELIRKARLTGAKVNDGEAADQLICGDEQVLYGDKAYDSHARRALLYRLGIQDGIMRRAPWGRAHHPPAELAARNRALTPIRCAVERVFARMKQWYGYRRVRYRGLARNNLQLQLLCIALNLRRAFKLCPA